MKNKFPEKQLRYLQSLLNEISTLGPNDAERFKICKGRAARIVRQLKRDYPNLNFMPPKPEGSGEMRRSEPPVSGV